MDNDDDVSDSAPLLNGEQAPDEFEDVLEKVGYGWFHHKLLIILSWAVSSDAVEIVCVSFILPSVDCELGLTTFEKGALNAIIFFGMMLGGFLWGPLSDIFGRQKILIICLLVNGIGGLISSLAHNFIFFIIFRLISGIGVGGSYPVVFSYVTEFQGRSYRGKVISFLSCLWMFGGMLTAGLAWLLVPQTDLHFNFLGLNFKSWRIFVIICTIPSLSSAFLTMLLPESPKYLIKVGRHTSAIKVLHQMALQNNTIQEGEKITNNVVVDPSFEHAETISLFTKLKITLSSLFSKRWRRTSISLILIQFGLAFGYYGILLWLPELFTHMNLNGGSVCSSHRPFNNSAGTLTNQSDPCSISALTATAPFLEAFLVNLSNLPGNVLSILLIDYVGRKPLLTGSMVITGLCVFFIAMVKNQHETLIITCCFGGLSAIGWNSLGVVSAEALPTQLRATSMGLSQGFARVAAISGNLAFGAMLDVHCVVPLFLASGMLVFGGLMALLLPNTTGRNIQ